MAFLQPVLLWGALAIVIPIIIHFWYQKKGKTIAWAATQWLIDKTNLQHRGVRLDEVPLLLIRCLLIILMVLLLARPIGDWFGKKDREVAAHVVEASRGLVSNYRFEIEEALKKGEKVFWISPETKELKDIENIPSVPDQNINLQTTVQHAAKYGSEIRIYLNNRASLAALPRVVLPVPYQLFTAIDSSKQTGVSYIQGKDQKKVFVDSQSGLLKTDTDKSNLAAEPVNKGEIKVLLHYKNTSERQTVQAALLALQEVYSIPLAIDFDPENGTNYNWVLTDQSIVNNRPQALYVISGHITDGILPENVIIVPDSLRLATSDLVEDGRLPEWLGEVLVQFYGLKKNDSLLSNSQLNALFVQSEHDEHAGSNVLYKLLLIAFALTLLVERWISLSKNPGHNYV
jgi:hypothetical protein